MYRHAYLVGPDGDGQVKREVLVSLVRALSTRSCLPLDDVRSARGCEGLGPRLLGRRLL